MSAGASTGRSGLAQLVLLTPTTMALTVPAMHSSESPWTILVTTQQGATDFGGGAT